jgi:pimeloyl-ACP methyl ester carboxylesterase/acyl carrier protein
MRPDLFPDDYDCAVQAITGICLDALKRDIVDIDADFFTLGADALTLVAIQLLIDEKLGLSVDERDIWLCRSVSSLAYLLCLYRHQNTSGRQWIELEGVNFCYRIAGSLRAGVTPKLVVAGGFQNMYSIPHLESLLVSDGPLIFVDTPGTGSADDIPHDADFRFLAACLNKILGQENLTKINLIALSYGGMAAIEFSGLWPEKIDHLILISASETQPAAVGQQIGEALDGLNPGINTQAVAAIHASPVCMVSTKDRKLRKAVSSLLENAQMSYASSQTTRFQRLQQCVAAQRPRTLRAPLTAPALFVTGEHDMITPIESTAESTTLFQQSQFCLIRDADHLVGAERPRELAELIIRFINDVRFPQEAWLKKCACPR